MNFWYLRRIGNGFHVIGGPEVGISILNKLVFPTPAEDFNMMLSNSFSSKEEILSLVSFETYASCDITYCLLELLCSGCKFDSGGMVESSVGLILMSSWKLSISVNDILLTSVLSISIGFNVLSTAALGM